MPYSSSVPIRHTDIKLTKREVNGNGSQICSIAEYVTVMYRNMNGSVIHHICSASYFHYARNLGIPIRKDRRTW